MKQVINSDKHYVHLPVIAITSGNVSTFELVDVDNSLASASDVRVGAVVKAVFLELWADSPTSSKTINSAVLKRPSGASAPSIANLGNMGAYINKKNVFMFHQGLAPSNGNVVPLFREWILIPKGKQRMGLGDSIVVTTGATGATMNICGFATFKEYF